MSLPTPEWITMEEYPVDFGSIEKVLPAGTFVKPIELTYLPKHIKETNAYIYYNAERSVFVYCHYGIILLPRDLIRRIT